MREGCGEGVGGVKLKREGEGGRGSKYQKCQKCPQILLGITTTIAYLDIFEGSVKSVVMVRMRRWLIGD